MARRIELDEGYISACLNSIRPFLDDESFKMIPDDESDNSGPFWLNDYITGDDPRVLVAMLRLLKPKTYLEIGSGISTRFTRWAVNRWKLPTSIVAIDPVPRAAMTNASDTFLPVSVLDVDMSVFAALQPGDILFHDGSHVTFSGSDTTHLFLEIMPLLKSGVNVHFHDIALPYEYPTPFDGRGYNEQYMMATALIFSDTWQVKLPVHYLARNGRLSRGGGSFWLQKR